MALSREMVNIIVGRGAKEQFFACHKVLLGHYSGFMKAAFYGKISEATCGGIEMPEDDAEVVGVFVSWCHTGQIFNHTSLESCWVLGDKIMSPRFANTAMYDMFDKYGAVDPGECITSADAAMVWHKTTENSRLRNFKKNTLKWMPPLSDQAIAKAVKKHKIYAGGPKTSYQTGWEVLLRKGGQFVVDIMLISNQTISPVEAPYKWNNHSNYLFPSEENLHSVLQARGLEDFIKVHKNLIVNS